jgi:hypothetical protein
MRLLHHNQLSLCVVMFGLITIARSATHPDDLGRSMPLRLLNSAADTLLMMASYGILLQYNTRRLSMSSSAALQEAQWV